MWPPHYQRLVNEDFIPKANPKGSLSQMPWSQSHCSYWHHFQWVLSGKVGSEWRWLQLSVDEPFWCWSQQAFGHSFQKQALQAQELIQASGLVVTVTFESVWFKTDTGLKCQVQQMVKILLHKGIFDSSMYALSSTTSACLWPLTGDCGRKGERMR